MKYFVAYKQSENDYIYISSIGSTIGKTPNYYSAIDFLNKENAENICKFLNEYDTTQEYIVISYEYSLKEE